MTILGVGTDVLDEDRICRLVNNGGNRFLEHWYTADEIDHCGRAARPECEAARYFAVKEAALKAIGFSSTGPLMWRDIEVLTDHRGATVVHLSGTIADHAAHMGVTRLHASTGRAASRVMAVVVAEG